MSGPATADEIAEEKRILRQETEKHIEFLDRLYKELEGLRKAGASLDSDLASLRQQYENEKAAREKADAKIAEMEKAQRDKQAEMEAKMQELKTQSQNAQEELQRQMQEMKSNFESEVAQLKSEISSLNNEVDTLKHTVADMQRAYDNMVLEKDASIADLRRQVLSADAQVQGVLFLRQNVDAFHLATDVIKEPVAACMLPDGCTLVADTLSGLLMFSPHSELIQKLNSEDWKWPQGLVYDTEAEEILVSLMRKFDDKTFRRVIMHFHLDWDDLHLYHRLREVRHVNGPKEAELDTHVAKEKLARAKNGDLYLTLADNTGSALYKLTPGSDDWAQLSKRPGQNFTDLAVLGQHGPITELLIVESRMGYLHKFSIRGNDIANRQSLAVVEKPACIAVDNDGLLFVQDLISGKVHQVNTHMEIVKDVCLIDDSVFSITANNGYLGVAMRQYKTIKIYRYSDTFIAAVASTHSVQP